MHCDVSAGNILLYKGARGQWQGMLTDWELAQDVTRTSDVTPGRRIVRFPFPIRSRCLK